MTVRVIADDSTEGREIKKALEDDSINYTLNNSFTIRWGEWMEKDEDEDGIVFNTSWSIKNTIDKENVILTLRRNHISCPSRIKPGKKTDFPIIGRKYEHESGKDISVIDSLDNYKRCDCDYFLEYLDITEEYLVHVMDLKVFYIEEKYLESGSNLDEPVIRSKAFGWGLKETDLADIKSEEQKTMCDLACKAVYALGLDFGVVNIGKSLEGKYYVLDVDACPKDMSSMCMEAYRFQFHALLNKYDSLVYSEDDITIGADPECIIKDRDTGWLIFASDFVRKEGYIGFDNRSIESGREYYPLLEIRPDYSRNPVKVFESISSILNDLSKYIHYKNIGFYAGSMPIFNYWVGGHIHFGTKPNSKLIKALDNYLALPLMMIEKAYTARRRKIRYGELGNYRPKPHGGFEYCTLSSWLVGPEITLGVLCLAKVIAHEYLNLDKEFLRSYSDIRAYYSVNKKYFADAVQEIVKSISNTCTYKDYSCCIKPLLKKVLSSQEWDEDGPINDAWEMESSDEIYKPAARCFIPKKRRKSLGIKVGNSITAAIGEKKYELRVYPKDDFSSQKESLVNLSPDICRETGIDEEDSMDLWFDSEKNILRLGPVLGIFSYKENDDYGIFGKQTTLFKKLIKFSKDKGLITYVFTINGAEWDKERIKGYTFDFQNDEWVEKYFPLPDVIYDRGDIVSRENYGSQAVKYINNVKKRNIKFINSLECINLTNDKWGTYLMLNSYESTRSCQPKTTEYSYTGQIIEWVKKYGHVFLKLKNGSRSKGIFSVEMLQSGRFELIHRNRYYVNERFEVSREDLEKVINIQLEKGGFQKEDFIIQKAIPSAKYNDKGFEIRVIMQKNSTGRWFRTCMAARCWSEEGKFIDTLNENDTKSSTVLDEVFGDKAELVRKKIRAAAGEVAEVMDSEDIQVGELAVDFAVDKNLNVFIIELNSKPDNLLAAIGAFRMRNLAIYRILEYAKYLSCGNHEVV